MDPTPGRSHEGNEGGDLNHYDNISQDNEPTDARRETDMVVAKRREEIEDDRRRITDNESETQITDRDLETYCATFGFKPEDLRGKKILDVGSGTRETFSKEAAAFGAEVYSMSPGLKKWLNRRKVQGLIMPDPRWQRRSVAARAQEIPFKDGLFDIVTSNFAIPSYINQLTLKDTRDETLKCIKEMLRVLKSGEKLYLYPATTQKVGAEAVAWLKENGHSISRWDHEVLVITKNVLANSDEQI